ncbi:MAG: hemerythrin domain-containing protein [Rhodocyclaceae bacterium]|nr:hemerythrin domain-containing protein [Rhodocyclaceae bacterium]
MDHLTAPLAAHHKACDEEFAIAEEAVANGDWGRASTLVPSFTQALETHFGVEEEHLFPAFEASTGMTGGPTRMMRMEHMQMRTLMADLAAALAARDRDEFLGCAETLLLLMQQHNMKEENILYPMCDQALAGHAKALGPVIASGLAVEA